MSRVSKIGIGGIPSSTACSSGRKTGISASLGVLLEG